MKYHNFELIPYTRGGMADMWWLNCALCAFAVHFRVLLLIEMQQVLGSLLSTDTSATL